MVNARCLRRHRSERGAAVFIVVMVITLLTAIGVFAARSTSLTDVAAGFEREAAQTSYISQLATNAVAAELGGGMANAYLIQMRSKPETCLANSGITTSPAPYCYRLFKSDLDARTPATGGEILLDPSSLSSTSGVSADFLVEMTDVGPAGKPIAGTDVGGTGYAFHYVSVGLTATAVTMPTSAAVCGPVDSIGMQRSHATAIVGPVPE
ncbi:MAG TPA: hypothetical protein VGI10_18830 [Polyangiaceae bacterium]|jgi:hypothetical protein